jgi:hypothetical protein
MRTNTLATALALSDRDLLARIDALAGKEREATAELVAHLAALELRPSLYAAEGYGSLFGYCTQGLRLSEDAACNRIAAARACRDFPAILDLLACGSVTLTSIRLLRPHLTRDNHEAVLGRARHKTYDEIVALVAELAPKPDVVATVRKLPAPTPVVTPTLMTASPAEADQSVPAASQAPLPPLTCPTARPIVQALAPERYRVQFTIGQEGHDRLRRVQSLLRREIPNGDPGVIFERALQLLLERVEKDKLGATARADRPAGSAYETRIRRATDSPPSRHIPNAVRRAVWRRDASQCAFVSAGGHRCTERNFLELHHIQPFALAGAATVRNISLRCRRHNQYEGELVFGSDQRPGVDSQGHAAGGALHGP